MVAAVFRRKIVLSLYAIYAIIGLAILLLAVPVVSAGLVRFIYGRGGDDHRRH